MVFTEPYSGTKGSKPPNVFTVVCGESVWSQKQCFIVSQEARGFCYAWSVIYLIMLANANSNSPIETYGGKATLKPGCNPSEHAVVYMRGDQPSLLLNENGMTKSPIEIIPSSSSIKSLPRAARIRLGRGQVIKHNVRAKDIGRVRDEDIPLLVSYWRLEIGRGMGMGLCHTQDDGQKLNYEV